jgi:broad specificity phosphatase PhoE
MSFSYPYSPVINLHVQGRISEEDAKRQAATAEAILKRLEGQPGVILADEVGMGKTFVALAVAASIALGDEEKRPVVVMVPSSLREKWPREFELFREKCLPQGLAARLKYASADRAESFLKLLDDKEPEKKKSIIFLTHGAMSRGLTDGWVKLALIQRALYRRRNTQDLIRCLCRWMDGLIGRMRWALQGRPDMCADLLSTDSERWLRVLRRYGVDPEGDADPETDDDPVPEALRRALRRLDTATTDRVFNVLMQIPRRESQYLDDRLTEARHAIEWELKGLWKECVEALDFRLPLLILDEAHHLKNAQTRLASLFQVPDAESDAEEISRGPLGGVFERMLFLTATPFQLGHFELCSVVERFSGTAWDGPAAPTCGKAGFLDQARQLRTCLDCAQEAAVNLDDGWGLLAREDLAVAGEQHEDVERWWDALGRGGPCSARAGMVLKRVEWARGKMKAAEQALRPWVIRHLRSRKLPPPHEHVERRRRLVGRAIVDDLAGPEAPGISVSGEALLPFLLAARATACTPESRPVFAEGLASSYEAFLLTRQTDLDDEAAEVKAVDKAGQWYLDHLKALLPQQDAAARSSHPKIRATVDRVLQIWRQREKAVVFCHYIATGRALRDHISEAIKNEIRHAAAVKLACPVDDAAAELDRVGKRFFDVDSPLRRACDREVTNLLSQYPTLTTHAEDLVGVVRSFLRTPSFLVRYFPLEEGRMNEESVKAALDSQDRSGLTLRQLLEGFCTFLVVYCGEEDRHRYIDALKKVQTGAYAGQDVASAFSEDERQGSNIESLAPNVRLVNGTTKPETRQRLMLTFNTPFYPEILIASSVLAEGVDLHLACRHMIHHDLCWNPSTLEQRTGRIDRIGAKAERCGAPIDVYLPYIGETQDEKQYRVVMDRERWFNVVMGGDFKVDARNTERLAERISLPRAVMEALTFRLDVTRQPTNHCDVGDVGVTLGSGLET